MVPNNLDKDNTGAIIDELRKSGVLAAADDRQLIRFCCACCRLIWEELPVEARQSLEVAEQYVKGEINSERLRAERLKLWTFWKILPNRHESTPEVNAIRAVICCLYERSWEGDLEDPDPNCEVDMLHWTMQFCNGVHATEQKVYRQLLIDIFGHLLKPQL